MHRTLLVACGGMGTTKVGMNRILKRRVQVVDYMRSAVTSGTYYDVNDLRQKKERLNKVQVEMESFLTDMEDLVQYKGEELKACREEQLLMGGTLPKMNETLWGGQHPVYDTNRGRWELNTADLARFESMKVNDLEGKEELDIDDLDSPFLDLNDPRIARFMEKYTENGVIDSNRLMQDILRNEFKRADTKDISDDDGEDGEVLDVVDDDGDYDMEDLDVEDDDDEDEEDEEESPVKMKKQPSSSNRTKNPRAKKGNNVNKKTVVSKIKN
jgi:hypothetical protein